MEAPSRRLAAAVLIYLVGIAVVAFTSYLFEKQRYLEDIDARLLAAASNLSEILPKDFHDIARSPDAISDEQDRYNLELLTSHAKSADMTYIYSYVMVDGEIFFTSCNYTEEDVKKGQVVTYWTGYPEGDQKYFDAMTATEPVYVTAGDRWGLFRTILMPMTSPSGLPYVAAADMDITVIEQALVDDMLYVLGLSLLFAFFVAPLVWAYHKTYSEMNRELRVLNSKLQQDIDQAKILEEELKQASSAAEAASRVKSQFLSNMSHELRTPINGILGVNQLLLDTSLNDEQHEYVNWAGQSALILLDTVNQILDTAAIEANGLVLHPEPVDMLTLIEEISQMFSSQVGAKRLDLVFHLATNLPATISVDVVRFRQVLINLIANALKFTSVGGVKVTLTWKDSRLVAEVQDSGIGIPSSKQQDIFEIFHQLDTSHSRTHDGSGLGLSIAQKICELMDGELRLQHSDSSGSLFAFSVDVPAVGDKTINRLAIRSGIRIGYCSLSHFNQQWLEYELGTADIEQFSSIEAINSQEAKISHLLVDASISDDDLVSLTQLSHDIELSLLLWPGQHVPQALKNRAKVIRKPLLRSDLTGFFGNSDG